MLVALVLPKLLDKLPERQVMLGGAALLVVGLFAGPLASEHYATLLALWFCLGMGYSLVQTPSGRLVRRSSREEDRPALFAAQFALSHACWLITYPLAGWLGAKAGLSASFLALAVLATIATIASARFWAAADPPEVEHSHDDLDQNHPHVQQGRRHSHDFVIDDDHPRWPN